jgi:hypothetical protein
MSKVQKMSFSKKDIYCPKVWREMNVKNSKKRHLGSSFTLVLSRQFVLSRLFCLASPPHPLSMPFPFFLVHTSSSLSVFSLIFIFSTCFNYRCLFQPCCVPTLEPASALNMSFKNRSPSVNNVPCTTTMAGRKSKKTKRFVSLESPTFDKHLHKHTQVQNV